MRLNKRGAALFQVLIVAAILAGLAAMVLRASLSRTVTARQVRHMVSSQMVIESCMAEVNNLWATKKPEAYAEDLDDCRMLPDGTKTYTCGKVVGNTEAPVGSGQAIGPVVATMAKQDGRCVITYSIAKGVGI